jgi:hypothetical protein
MIAIATNARKKIWTDNERDGGSVAIGGSENLLPGFGGPIAKLSKERDWEA